MTDELSRAFAALADPTRRDIVARLAVSDATVGELAGPYAMSLQAVSKHLKVLTDAGLVSQRREAQRRPAHLEAEVLDLLTTWTSRYQRLAEERYQRLDALLADATRGEPGGQSGGEATHQPGGDPPDGRRPTRRANRHTDHHLRRPHDHPTGPHHDRAH